MKPLISDEALDELVRGANGSIQTLRQYGGSPACLIGAGVLSQMVAAIALLREGGARQDAPRTGRRHNLKRRRVPLNLSEALVAFGKLRGTHPDSETTAKLGLRLVREIQYLHRLLAAVRSTLPDTHDGYIDPQQLDTALARTAVRNEQESA